MSDPDPYSRHYWRLVDDPKFADIYADDHHYACWSRLLMIADQAWPASAHIPATARKASVAKLAEVGLLDLLHDGRFKMRGLDKERAKRSDSARNAAAKRWQSSGNAEPMPSKAEHRREETRNAGVRAPESRPPRVMTPEEAEALLAVASEKI